MKYALFIDFENIYYPYYGRPEGTPDKFIDYLKNIIKDHETPETPDERQIIISKAYADWEKIWAKESYGFQRELTLIGIHPEYVMGKREKNSTDIALSLDAQKILFTRKDIGGFIIVGSDRDYMPIVNLIKKNDKKIIVYGWEDSFSGDLREIIGDTNTRFLEQYDRLSDTKTEHKENAKNLIETPGIPSMEDVKHTGYEIQQNKSGTIIHRRPLVVLTEENLNKTIELIKKAENESGAKEIRLTNLYRDYMNDNFQNLSNEQRKEIIGKLGNENIITISQKKSDTGQYLVLQLNHEHPKVKKPLQI
ncbi:MAG: NYN domain-containing protein [Deltaproteobacteria bacterium]|nr:NYN domain-containing protein [Deltaproteobacteria bacterium]